MTAETWLAFSSTSPPLKRIPSDAATPEPTITAVGVARPRAHGHAMTRTAEPNSKASMPPSATPAKSMSACGTIFHATAMTHARYVARATMTTAGTKWAATRSACACTAGLRICASETSRMILASTVSLPTAPTETHRTPEPLTEPPTTASAAALGTGVASPVIIASSTVEEPCETVPSTGTLAPGTTLQRSPLARDDTGTSTGSACTDAQSMAVGGCSLTSLPIASLALPLADASRYLPSSMNVMSIADVSKHSFSQPSSPADCQQSSVKATE
mmetsp:Transcript_28316/g.72828  ORF Transcript_28316/g.72828 Transcript_28316/m.72828 type:complete len:274 (+) Transcript_28316:1864-2685(+)